MRSAVPALGTRASDDRSDARACSAHARSTKAASRCPTASASRLRVVSNSWAG